MPENFTSFIGSYWRKRTHWAICIDCGYRRYHLTTYRANKVAMYHEKFHAHHTVQIDTDRLTKPTIRHGYIG